MATLTKRLFLLFFTVFAGGASAQDQSQLVDKSQLLCVIDNINKYLNVKTNPVLVILSICPQADLDAEAIGRLTRNELPEPRLTADKGGVVRFLVLSKAELNCLSPYRPLIDETKKPVFSLPKHLCAK
jgi:hypothetical protein